jgi:hypothetical protein
MVILMLNQEDSFPLLRYLTVWEHELAKNMSTRTEDNESLKAANKQLEKDNKNLQIIKRIIPVIHLFPSSALIVHQTFVMHLLPIQFQVL